MARTNRQNSERKKAPRRKPAGEAKEKTSGKPDSDRSEPEPVQLKPVLGIAPGYYVSALLAAALVASIFAVLYLPGLSSPQRDVTIETSPPGAEIRHDGTRIGSTPATVSLPRGRQTVTLSRPGFTEKELEVDVPTRRFATLLVPAKTTAEAVLSPRSGIVDPDIDSRAETGTGSEAGPGTESGVPSQPLPRSGGYIETLNDLFARTGNELSTWAEIGESTYRRPLPPLLSTLARDIAAITAQTAVDTPTTAADQAKQHQEFLLSSIQNVTSHALARDLTAASWQASSGAGTPSGLSASKIVHNFIRADSNSDGLPAWLVNIAGSALSSDIRNAPFYREFLERNSDLDSVYSNTLDKAVEAVVRGQDGAGEQISIDVQLAAQPFVRVPGGQVLLGYSEALGRNDSAGTKALADVGSFYMTRTPVTHADWNAFVENNPEWHPDNRRTLIEEGLVDSGYLETESGNVSDDEPVTGISFYAAKAFAQWIDGLAGENWRISLPSERQWAHAAALDRHNRDNEGLQFGFSTGARTLSDETDRAGNLGLIDMLGNVWEWTQTPYYSADTVVRLAAGYAGNGFANAAVVRGGSWANSSGEIGVESRGGQRTNWATPFLGFRLVAEETGD